MPFLPTGSTLPSARPCQNKTPLLLLTSVQSHRNPETIDIQSRDYWCKVVDMLQQNWALIDPAGGGCIVYFIHDQSGVFDQMLFGSIEEGEAGLRRNGFRRFAEDPEAGSFLTPVVSRNSAATDRPRWRAFWRG